MNTDTVTNHRDWAGKAAGISFLGFWLFVLLLPGLSLPAAGQSARTPFVPDDCKQYIGTARSTLETRRTEIEGRIQKMRADLLSADPEKTRAIMRELRRTQEDMLELVFALDCVRPAEPAKSAAPSAERAPAASPPPSRGLQSQATPPPPPPAAPQAMRRAVPEAPQAVEVTTYFATNRKKATSPASASETFGNEGLGDLTFGKAVVSIPASHTAGNIELPKLWKFERTADPNKHFVLKAVAPLETDAAKAELAERLKADASRSMLVFVHGYNSSFEDAALRTAQLAYDLKFPGTPFFYSWPSANRVRAYLQDEETARLCESVFETVIGQLSSLPVESIYIVAHSMGNRVVGHGLQAFVEKGNSTKHIKELLLAAPDINADLFKTTIAPRLAQMQGTRTTIYASSGDLALIASKVVHGFRRVGESSGGVLVFRGLDTVDASGASTSTRNLGHSYLVDSAPVIKDLHSIIASKLAAKARGLLEKGAAPDIYWQLPQ